MKRLDDDVPRPLPVHDAGWQAELTLGFHRASGATRLTERLHRGPLRVQKPLYPEGRDVCHAIIVHPPGGVAGGDRLTIRAQAGDRAAAFLTTPGAAKWYRANGKHAVQDVALRVGAGATLEWMPQETIFFDAAQVRLSHTVDLAEDAGYIGAEILCFGRTASGERFKQGSVAQLTAVRRGGRLLWFEQGTIEGGSSAMTSPLGLAGNTVCATLIAVGALRSGVAGDVRAACGDEAGVTHMKSLLVVRHLGDSSEAARGLLLRAWQVLRPAMFARDAVVPRIWNT